MTRSRRNPSSPARNLAVMAVAALGLAVPAEAWGPGAHARITTEAIETLPKGLKAYYKAHRLEIPSLSAEGSTAEDAPERQIGRAHV